jgi:ABC-type uncharacterized transport system permease subunit
MQLPVAPEVIVPAAGYLLACLAYGVHFRYRTGATRLFATLSLKLVAVAHLVYLVGVGTELGQLPVSSIGEGLSAAALAVALTHSLIETVEPERVTGLWGAGLAFALQLLATLLHRPTPVGSEALAAPGVAVHVGLAIAACGAWLLAALLGFLLLDLQRQTTAGRFTGMIGNLPRLPVVESLTVAALWTGFALMSGSTMVGAVGSGALYSNGPLRDPRFLVLFTLVVCYGIGIVGVTRGGRRPVATAAVALGGAGLMAGLLLAAGAALQLLRG